MAITLTLTMRQSESSVTTTVTTTGNHMIAMREAGHADAAQTSSLTRYWLAISATITGESLRSESIVRPSQKLVWHNNDHVRVLAACT